MPPNYACSSFSVSSLTLCHLTLGSQQHPDLATRYPMAPLYRRIFPGVLQLACDPDQVTRQLFLTLAFQVIHWFTNSQMFENPDTMVLLEAIMVSFLYACYSPEMIQCCDDLSWDFN